LYDEQVSENWFSPEIPQAGKGFIEIKKNRLFA
jgi:hypothetical protein